MQLLVVLPNIALAFALALALALALHSILVSGGLHIKRNK